MTDINPTTEELCGENEAPCDCGYSNCDECGPIAQARFAAEVARMDWWDSLTDRQREDEIKRAM